MPENKTPALPPLPSPSPPTAGCAFWDVKDVAEYLHVSAPTIWRYRREKPGFPQPLRFSYRVSRWRRSDVVRWADSFNADSVPAMGAA